MRVEWKGALCHYAPYAGSILQIEPDISSGEVGFKLASDGINTKCLVQSGTIEPAIQLLERRYTMEEKQLPVYESPKVVTYTDEELLEELGPAQTGYVKGDSAF